MSEALLKEAPKEALASAGGKDIYLIGGMDAEMHQAKKRIMRHGGAVIDLGLKWEDATQVGVKAYADEIQKIKAEGRTPVAIELTGADQIPGVVDIDHHGNKMDRPTSLYQVSERLGIEPTFIDRLVAANDAGYIPAMEALLETEYLPKLRETNGDEKAEGRKKLLIDLIRAKDRQMQGVTPEMEQEAEEAIKKAEVKPNGLIIVRIEGSRHSPVSDRLYRSGQKPNYAVVCNSDKEEKEVWFFGQGDICQEVSTHYKALQEERKEQAPDSKSNEYFSFGFGPGYGSSEGSGACMVVATNPVEIIDYITTAETQRAAT